MSKILAVVIAALGLSINTVDVEAKRLGGGKSLGMQRSAPKQIAPKPPAQQQAQQAAQPANAAQPAAAAATQKNKWLGPLAGLALGAGLAALFLNNGVAGLLAGLALMLGVAALAFFAFRMLRSRMAGAGAPATEAYTRYDSNNLGSGSAQPGSVAAMGDGANDSAQSWPANFDMQGFLRHARLNFVKLQEANDHRDASALADFLTPDLLDDIRSQWAAEGPAQGKTEVLMLQADLVQVATEGLLYIAQVRFTGQLREDGVEHEISEIWNLEKAIRGDTGWLLAGIQQD
jgi:predicted lipid-binding transport protein (Tim44 family)